MTLLGDKDRRNDSTTDNDATILELTYLVWQDFINNLPKNVIRKPFSKEWSLS